MDHKNTQAQIKEAFEQASPEEQQKFLDAIKSLSKLPAFTKELPDLIKKIRGDAVQNALQVRQYAFYVALLIVLGIFAFFGYKLYLSLTEKERKREEKLKAKQEKSKKKK